MKQKSPLNKSSAFLPQLEGLRAYAILFVIIAHWQVDGNAYEYWIRWAGVWGITFFYVLSGFLIGNIVLKENENLKDKTLKTMLPVLKVFYIRRMLRIFPIYYLTIFVLLIIGFPLCIDKVFPWLFFHASNLYIFFHGWIWPITHFWSLAVEEHFILIFPLLIFFIPKRFVLHAIIGMGITGIVCRTGLYLAHHEYYHIFTLSSFDSLAIGVLLAYLKMKYQNLSYMHLIGVVGLVLYVFLPLPSFLYFTGKTLLKVAIPSAALCSMALVYFASNGIGGITKLFLENKVCLYIGKIGYGLYVYHNLIPDLTTYLFEKCNITMPVSPILYAINALILLFLATISYYAIENPIYSFRKYFQYSYLRK